MKPEILLYVFGELFFVGFFFFFAFTITKGVSRSQIIEVIYKLQHIVFSPLISIIVLTKI